MTTHEWDVPVDYPGDFRTCARCGVTVHTRKSTGEHRLIRSRGDKMSVMYGGRSPDTRSVGDDCDEETARQVMES